MILNEHGASRATCISKWLAGTAGACLLAAASISCLPLSQAAEKDMNSSPEIVTNWTETEMSVLGEQRPLMARVMFGQASGFSFASSDESVCSIDENGVVTATGDGKALVTVTASVGGGEDVSRELPVSVERRRQSVSPSWTWQGVSAGSSVALEASSSAALPLEYASSDTSVADVDAEGNIVAISPGEAVITVRQPGDDEWQPAEASSTVIVTEGTCDRTAALEPFFEAMRVQQEWSWNASYGGGRVTIENSKTIGNCTTFPTASLQRVGLLPENTIVWPHSRHAKAHPEYFELYDANDTPAALVAAGRLQVGDIVRFPNPMHSMVYMGMDEKGRPLWNTAGRVTGPTSNRAKLMTRLSSYEKAHITSILRIRTYPVNLSYEGPGIADGGGEVMAKQGCTVSFHPEPGHRLVKLSVDGSPIDISDSMKAYTLEEVLEGHDIHAVFE